MIYIHVPFCHRKCTYCAFYSMGAQTERRQTLYVDALIAEMEARKGEQAHPIRTVYFGGGTPSILPIGELGRIVDGLRRCFDLSHLEEATLEANPEDLTPEYLTSLRDLGLFNRLSIGVQSLDDDMLRLIGRRHTAQQAFEAVENARRAGFDNISIDFIYGLPSNPDFPIIIEFLGIVSHVSAYALTVEEGTALARQVEQGRVVLPGEDEVVKQYYAVCKQLEDFGFRQYEVSNFARPGCESKHNSRYWDRTPYLGLGPGAHSFSLFDGGSTSVAHVEKRRWNKPDGTYEEETLTEADAYNEMLMTTLRTTRGIALVHVPEEQMERLHHGMKRYVDCGWIVLKDNHYAPTKEGLLHADGIAAELFV